MESWEKGALGGSADQYVLWKSGEQLRKILTLEIPCDPSGTSLDAAAYAGHCKSLHLSQI